MNTFVIIKKCIVVQKENFIIIMKEIYINSYRFYKR